jgi:hypothetical protein
MLGHSKHCPQSGLTLTYSVHIYVLLSILGQFAMHILFLVTAVNEASKHMPEECIQPDSDFHPTACSVGWWLMAGAGLF